MAHFCFTLLSIVVQYSTNMLGLRYALQEAQVRSISGLGTNPTLTELSRIRGVQMK